MIKVYAILTVIVITICLPAAGSFGRQATGQAAGGNKATEAVASNTDNWQQKWDRLVADAKKEGKVVVCYSEGTVREILSKAFMDRYGIKLEFIVGKPAETVVKVQRERSGGLFLEDVFIAGIGTVVSTLGQEGALQQLDDVLLLPEIRDPKNWWGGNLIWGDEQHRLLMFLAYANDPLSINMDMVKNNEIRSYKDLLNPKWKGKISCLDPRTAGGGNSSFTYWGETLGHSFLRELAKQDITFTRVARLQAEWLARGKHPIGIGVNEGAWGTLKKAGANLGRVKAVEGAYISGGSGGVLLLNNAPHPNAAKLFINWLLSREGVTVFTRAVGSESARVDVPTDFLDSDRLRKSGVKYYPLISPDDEIKKRKYQKLAEEIFGQQLE